MSITWTALGAEGRRIAAAEFLTRSQAARLADGVASPARRTPGFAALYNWATDPLHPLMPEEQAIIAADPQLRRSLARLVGRVGQLHAPAAAAASSGGLDARSGPGFTIRLTISRADPQQTYVTIEIDAAALADDASPSALLVLRDGVPVGKLPLEEPQDGRVQLLESSESAAVRGVRAADTELVLV